MKKIIAVCLVLAMLLPFFRITASATSSLELRYSIQMKSLTDLLHSDVKTMAKVHESKRKTVFISVSDSTSKAVTVYDSDKNLEIALYEALKRAKKTKINPLWAKLEVVTEATKISYSDFKKMCAEKGRKNLDYTLRQGIAFNSYFGRAITEGELNTGDFLSYETGELDLERINAFFKKNGKKQLEEIPDTLYLFKTQSYFSESGEAVRLNSGEYSNHGTREYTLDKDEIKLLMKKSSTYLADSIDENGKFVYGYYPIDNEELKGYNIVRHAGTVWNLLLQYEVTRDKSLIAPINRSIEYLTSQLRYKDENTAFIEYDREYNVGANGISLLAYVCYSQIFHTDKYNDVIEALANGVLYFQKEDGGFNHGLNKKDFSVSREFIVVFYDGEAAFGLLKAYELTGNEEYLRAAENAADYFIANNYEELHSHWIAYTFNELTKHSPRPEYFSFGLLNIHGYTDRVSRTVSSAHTVNETMGASFELYDRYLKSGIECELPEGFDGDMLIKAFRHRTKWGMNCFMQPEQAMYFPDPQIVLNSFVVREDRFRIRIDDIQHFMGGYYLYYINYENLMEY